MGSLITTAPWLLAALLPALPAAAGPDDPTSEDQQIRRLDELLAGIDVTKPPRGIDPAIWALRVPADNAMTAARVALGKKLYFERKLSSDGTVSCATCHDVTKGFGDAHPVSEGIEKKTGRRNAPTTLNAALLRDQFWDGRSATLEEQAGLPILNPIEMGHPTREAAIRALSADADYRRLFREAYGRDVNYGDLERAIAAFERTLIFLDAPFDDFLAGRTDALSPQAREGWRLFNGKARCAACHHLNASNPLGTDFLHHNIGVAARTRDFEALARKATGELGESPSKEKLDRLALETDLSEIGRFLVTRNRGDIGAFKTQQIRNIGLTAPYMHDGSLATLWDVMDHYNKGGEANLFLDGGVEPLDLTDGEIDAVVAFLFSLTDKRLARENQAALEQQRAQARRVRPIRDTDLSSRKVIQYEDRVFKDRR